MASIGVLVCDHIDPEVIAEGHPDYEDRYRHLLGPAAEDSRFYDLPAGEMPSAVQECDAWLVGGSRLSAHTDEGFIPALVDHVARAAEAGRPLVGICFGHQVVARALGGQVSPAGGWGVGVQDYEVVAPAPWMAESPRSFAIVASHRDQVTALPPGAEVVARAPYCPTAAYRVAQRVFCVQGHPEFDTALSATLTRRRRHEIGETTADAAMASLHRHPDNELVAAWIRDFLHRAGRAGDSTTDTPAPRP